MYVTKLHANNDSKCQLFTRLNVLIVLLKYINDSKCHLLTRPNVPIVLLEYVNIFNPSDNMKQSFGRGCPVLYHSILLHFILSMAIVAN